MQKGHPVTMTGEEARTVRLADGGLPSEERWARVRE